MTVSSPTIQPPTMKSAAKSKKRCVPKRAVSFAKTCKHEPPSSRKAKRYPTDAPLQPESKQRKYQRRGSKTPAMLLLSKADLETILGKAENQQQRTINPGSPVRRLSLMTTLKQNLERSCNLEPSKTLRRMSMVYGKEL